MDERTPGLQAERPHELRYAAPSVESTDRDDRLLIRMVLVGTSIFILAIVSTIIATVAEVQRFVPLLPEWWIKLAIGAHVILVAVLVQATWRSWHVSAPIPWPPPEPLRRAWVGAALFTVSLEIGLLIGFTFLQWDSLRDEQGGHTASAIVQSILVTLGSALERSAPLLIIPLVLGGPPTVRVRRLCLLAACFVLPTLYREATWLARALQHATPELSFPWMYSLTGLAAATTLVLLFLTWRTPRILLLRLSVATGLAMLMAEFLRIGVADMASSPFPMSLFMLSEAARTLAFDALPVWVLAWLSFRLSDRALQDPPPAG